VRAADLILYGARPAGAAEGAPPVSVVVRDGRIAALCDEPDARRWAGPRTHTVDLRGRTLTPGLVDSHLHPALGMRLAAGTDLSGLRTPAQVRAALAAARPGPGGWVLGWGLDPNALGDEPAEATLLDGVLGAAPAAVRLFDGHSMLASTEALRRAGVTGPRRFASSSRIVCDSAGRPTGLLLEEAAMGLVDAVVPEPEFAARRAALAELFAAMAATGLTGGHVMDCDGDALELYADLERAGELPLRLRIAPWRRPEDDDRRVAELLALQGRRGRLWQVAGVKLFMDGTVDNGTAWLHEPDCHGESAHPYWRDPGDYTAAVHQLAALGVPTATHAIGDAAVGHVLDALATVPLGTPPLGTPPLGTPPLGTPPPVGRHRVEHLETLPADQLPRFAALGVVASMQPSHATDYTRADHSDNWSRRLGTSRADRAWRCADLLAAGALLALGSDWPIAPFDPRIVLAAAVLRRPYDRPDLAPVAPGQALTPAQALAGYTRGPALVAGEDGGGGRVEAGAPADLTVFDDDPLAVRPDQLPHLPVALTVVDGVIRHRAPALA
jgi:predicted amidohydrolase YtcJ